MMQLCTWETASVCQRHKLTCGKDYIPGNQFVVNDGKLRELDSRHPCDGDVSSFPVELDVICGVSVCEWEGGQVWILWQVNRASV